MHWIFIGASHIFTPQLTMPPFKASSHINQFNVSRNSLKHNVHCVCDKTINHISSLLFWVSVKPQNHFYFVGGLVSLHLYPKVKSNWPKILLHRTVFKHQTRSEWLRLSLCAVNHFQWRQKNTCKKYICLYNATVSESGSSVHTSASVITESCRPELELITKLP